MHLSIETAENYCRKFYDENECEISHIQSTYCLTDADQLAVECRIYWREDGITQEDHWVVWLIGERLYGEC